MFARRQKILGARSEPEMGPRLRTLARRRLLWDSLALLLFSAAMGLALLLLVVNLFWSGWAMAFVLAPVGLLVRRMLVENRFWQVARRVEERFPELRGKLVAAIQLRQWQGQREGYSQEMIAAAVAEVEKRLAPLSLGQLVKKQRVVWAGAGLAVMAVGFALVAGTAPARVRVGLSNAFGAGSAGIEFEVQPKDTAVMPGS
ncbi:hypothetical protein FJY70_02615, partial [candidate division WOR-3 bacterium]|nr:hypothetical protein [candidate division WOR-3 bacterium]